LESSRFFFNDPATTEIYTLSLHDALPICLGPERQPQLRGAGPQSGAGLVPDRKEHTSELQSPDHLVCRLLLEKKKIQTHTNYNKKKKHTQNTQPPTNKTQ